MKNFKIYIVMGLMIYVKQLHAADIQVEDFRFNIKGGVSFSAMYFDNPGFLRRHDSYILNDMLAEISPSDDYSSKIKFFAGFGVLQKQSIFKIFSPVPPVDIALQYGWLQVPTFKDHNIEVGHLITKLGVESSVSFRNHHTLLGAIYTAQPSHYSGVRFNTSLGHYNYYWEVTNDPTIGDASAAVGIYKQSHDHYISVSYYEAISERSMIDMVFSQQIGDIKYAINIDYHALEDTRQNQDKNALGIALYSTYESDAWVWSSRIELIDDGNTGIYQFDKGYTITFSPSYKLTTDQQIRAEFLYANSHGNPFRNSDGGFEPNQWVTTLQIILRY